MNKHAHKNPPAQYPSCSAGWSPLSACVSTSNTLTSALHPVAAHYSNEPLATDVLSFRLSSSGGVSVTDLSADCQDSVGLDLIDLIQKTMDAMVAHFHPSMQLHKGFADCLTILRNCAHITPSRVLNAIASTKLLAPRATDVDVGVCTPKTPDPSIGWHNLQCPICFLKQLPQCQETLTSVSKTLTCVSRHARSCGRIDFSFHWYWVSGQCGAVAV